jgi:hypothetical protein
MIDAMWKVINVTDGTVEEIGVADSGIIWPGSIIAIGDGQYEVLCTDDGCAYVTDTTQPRT